jgi:hypothetical protein
MPGERDGGGIDARLVDVDVNSDVDLDVDLDVVVDGSWI